jgi:TP901 family phage tail tape measure protein
MAVTAGVSGGSSLGTLFIRLTANATDLVRGMQQAETAVDRSSGVMLKRITIMGAAMVGTLTAVGAAAVREFGQFESSFAGVRKTVTATEGDFQKLSDGLRKMALEIPVNVNELAKIAEVGGQLGIQGVRDIEKFTKTISQVTIATGIAGEEAATEFARIANVMQEPIMNIDRMGSVVAQLGDAGAATEKEILAMGSRIAGAGKIAGLTTAEVFGIASAFSSVGMEAEAGGTAVQKVLLDLNAQGRRGIGEFVKFLDELKASGTGAQQTLEELGFEDVRLQRAFLSLAGAGNLLNDQLRIGTQEWEKNTRLTEETEKRTATLFSQFTLLANTLRDFAITLGEGIAPAVRMLNEELKTWMATTGTQNEELKKMGEFMGSTFYAALKSVIAIIQGVKDAFKAMAIAMSFAAEMVLRSWDLMLRGIKIIVDNMVNGIIGGINTALSYIDKLSVRLGGKAFGGIDFKMNMGIPDLKPWAEGFKQHRQDLFNELVATHTETTGAIKKNTEEATYSLEELRMLASSTTKMVADAARPLKEKENEAVKKMLGQMPSAKQISGPKTFGFGFGSQDMGDAYGIFNDAEEAKNNLKILADIQEREKEMTQAQRDEMYEIQAAYHERLKKLKEAEYELAIVSAQSMFGDLASIAEAFAGKQSGIYKAMFAASKAFAIAESIVKIQQGIAAAAAMPWPLNIAAIASVVAATANIVSSIQAVKLEFGGARALGGPVAPGSAYIVGEKGPELFSPGMKGTIIPNNALGSQVNVIINNNAPGATGRVTSDREEGGQRWIEVAVERAKRETAADIAEDRGPVARAMKRTYPNLRRGGA